MNFTVHAGTQARRARAGQGEARRGTARLGRAWHGAFGLIGYQGVACTLRAEERTCFGAAVLLPREGCDGVRFLRSSILAGVCAVSVVGCAVMPRVESVTVAAPTPTVLVHRPKKPMLTAVQRRELHAWFRHLAFVRWLAAYDAWLAVQVFPPIPAALLSTVACIKRVESGDYTEHSHPDEGSGAYQYIGTTWREWEARWMAATPLYLGPSFVLAYEAPPDVQDAVLVFTLTHGGAGNWSGTDGCTGY